MSQPLLPAFDKIPDTIEKYMVLLRDVTDKVICLRRNNQNRSIKEIIGHMIDSASNNTHRIVHLQYRQSPVEFPNYATNGNNDRWIGIQRYQEENLDVLLSLWKYIHLHMLHVVSGIDDLKKEQEWISEPGKTITLEEMVLDFPRHFFMHISEIDELLNH